MMLKNNLYSSLALFLCIYICHAGVLRNKYEKNYQDFSLDNHKGNGQHIPIFHNKYSSNAIPMPDYGKKLRKNADYFKYRVKQERESLKKQPQYRHHSPRISTNNSTDADTVNATTSVQKNDLKVMLRNMYPEVSVNLRNANDFREGLKTVVASSSSRKPHKKHSQKAHMKYGNGKKYLRNQHLLSSTETVISHVPYLRNKVKKNISNLQKEHRNVKRIKDRKVMNVPKHGENIVKDSAMEYKYIPKPTLKSGAKHGIPKQKHRKTHRKNSKLNSHRTEPYTNVQRQEKPIKKAKSRIKVKNKGNIRMHKTNTTHENYSKLHNKINSTFDVKFRKSKKLKDKKDKNFYMLSNMKSKNDKRLRLTTTTISNGAEEKKNAVASNHNIKKKFKLNKHKETSLRKTDKDLGKKIQKMNLKKGRLTSKNGLSNDKENGKNKNMKFNHKKPVNKSHSKIKLQAVKNKLNSTPDINIHINIETEGVISTTEGDISTTEGDVSTTVRITTAITEKIQNKDYIKHGNYQDESKQISRINQQGNKKEENVNNYQQVTDSSLISSTSRSTDGSNMISSEKFDDVLLKTNKSDVVVSGTSITESGITHESETKEYTNPDNNRQENVLKSGINQQDSKQEDNRKNYQKDTDSLLISSTSRSITGVSNSISSETYDDALLKTSLPNVDVTDISSTQFLVTQGKQHKDYINTDNYQEENKLKSRIDHQGNREEIGNNHEQVTGSALTSATSGSTTNDPNVITSQIYDDLSLKTSTSDVVLSSISNMESGTTQESQYEDYANPDIYPQGNKRKSLTDHQDNSREDNENNYQYGTESSLPSPTSKSTAGVSNMITSEGSYSALLTNSTLDADYYPNVMTSIKLKDIFDDDTYDSAEITTFGLDNDAA